MLNSRRQLHDTSLTAPLRGRSFRTRRPPTLSAALTGLAYASYFLVGLFLDWAVTYSGLWIWLAVGGGFLLALINGIDRYEA